MGFFSILFQLFSRMDVFQKLLDTGFFRAFRHYILMLLLLSLLLACGYSCSYSPMIHSVCNGLFEQIGALRITPEKGVHTLNNPEKKQSYILDDRLRFDYFPGNTLQGTFRPDTTPFGVICMDKGFLFWGETPDDAGGKQYLTFPFLLDMELRKEDGIRLGLTAERMSEYLRETFILKPGEKLSVKPQEENAESTASLLRTVFWFSTFFASLFGMFMISGGTILLLSLFQTIWSGMQTKRLTFRQNLVLLIYASFPAMLISGLYSCVALPWFSPQNVFLLVFFIYSMIVFRKINQFLNPPQNTNHDEI